MLAIRTLKRAKQYYLTTVLTLALTLSMVLSVFSLVDLVFFAPLPYDNSENLYMLEGTIKSESFNGTSTNSQIITHIKNNNDAFSDIAAYHTWTDYKLYDQAERPEVRVILATNNLFQLLGVKPQLGRFFNQTEAMGSKQPSVILGYRTWQQHYQSNQNIIGQKIQLNQRRFTVIGVAPDNLVLPVYNNINEALWIPMDMDETFKPKNKFFVGAYKAVARLKADTDSTDAGLSQIAKQLNTLAFQGAQLYTPNVLKDFTVGAQLTLFKQALQGDSGQIVLMLLVGVILLMVIALINLSSMQLAKSLSKTKTTAISYAFGATNKQLLAESFKHNISIIGLAVFIALFLTSSSFFVIQTLAFDSIARLDTLHISANTLLFSALLAILIALLYSAIELSVVKEKNLTSSLQSSGKGVGKQMSAGISHLLIGLQVLFSFLVLVAASHVVLQTLFEALRDNGLNTENKWSLTVNYSNIEKTAERENIHQALLTQLTQLNALAQLEQISEPRLPQSLNVSQLYDKNNQYIAQARSIRISAGYLAALNLTIIGKPFQPGDSELKNYPVIVNQRLADLINRNSHQVLGQKISRDGKSFHSIIGVAANTYVPGNIENEAYEVYMPQHYQGERQYSFLLTAIDHHQLEKQVRGAITKVDSRMDIVELVTLDQQFDKKRERHLFASWIAITLASISLLMVCIGINGIVNYMVQMRRYDLGVKLAMGACNRQLLKDSLAELMQPVTVSLIFAFSLSFLLIGYSNTRTDITFAPNWPLVAIIWCGFCILSLIVSFFPIRKILINDPIKALRNE